VLSDDTKRREYDEARSLFGSGLGGLGGYRPGSYAGGGCPGFDIGDLLNRAGGRPGLRRRAGRAVRRGRSTGRAPQRGTDVEADVTLSFADAVRGATVPLQLTTTGGCETCRGLGAPPAPPRDLRGSAAGRA
jgi:molecular chaperone DnaJ